MTAVTSKMNRMVLLYMLILSMVSLPTILPKHLVVETADNQGGDDYEGSPPLLPQPGDRQYYSISPEGPKKNYKKELMKITDEMKRQGKDYGGFTDFLKGALKVVEKKGEDYHMDWWIRW